ncbi:hypothetical protein MASR2M70_11730 [Bacillota bacterium]
MNLYMNLFLNGCSVFLAPIAGVLICHYILVSRKKLDVQSLYAKDGAYNYSGITGLTSKIGISHFVIAAILLICAFAGSGDWLTQVTSIGVTIKAILLLLTLYSVSVGLFLMAHRKGGVNPLAMMTMSVSVLICYSGIFFDKLSLLYDASYFVGILISIALYYFAMKKFIKDKFVEAA